MSHDTSLGGSRREFPATTLGLVARLRTAWPQDRRAIVETLCLRYWRPVYCYVRSAWSSTTEDAKDLTQAFFLWLFEGEVLAKYDPDRAGFRFFLKGLLRNFVDHRQRALQALKRGGGATLVPIDSVAEPAAALSGDPERDFDDAWMDEVLRGAVERVRAEFRGGPRERQFQVFEAHDLTDGEPPAYADLAARFGIQESDVRNHLSAVRRRLREEVRAELAETADPLQPLDGEWKVFGNA